MNAITLKIENTLRDLPPAEAQALEEILKKLLVFAHPARTQGASFQPTPYQTQPQALGLRSGLIYNNWTELLDAAEGPDWK